MKIFINGVNITYCRVDTFVVSKGGFIEPKIEASSFKKSSNTLISCDL